MFIRQLFYLIPTLYWEWGSRKKLEKRQLRMLNDFLQNAYYAVPYYRNNEAYSQLLTSLNDIRKIPITNKALVKKDCESFHSEKYCKPGKSIPLRTSGTTGEPIVFYHDSNSIDYNTSINFRRVFATKKYSPFYNTYHFTPIPREKMLCERFGLFRRTVISCHLPISELKRIILEKKTKCIVSYPVHLGETIAAMSEEELKEARKFIKLIFTEAEMLTEQNRAFMQDSLNTEIFDDYGSWDVLTISYECSHHRSHICEDRLLLEILDDEGNPVPDGVEGNIIISSFMGKAMPLVRYDIGDRGIVSSEPCPCGRTFKTLKLTQGRTDYCIYLENGEKIYTHTLLWLTCIVDGVRDIFIYQDKKGVVTVYFIPIDKEGRENDEIEAFILDYFIENIGITPQIKATDHVPKAESGKAQRIYSELSEDEAMNLIVK